MKIDISLTKNPYRAIVRKHVKGYYRNGYINYYEVRDLSESIDDFLAEAQDSIDQGDIASAFNMFTAVLEVLPGIFDSSDDSYGYLSSCTNYTIDLFNKLMEFKENESFRRKFYSYLIKTYTSNKLGSWNWDFSILENAVELLKTEKEISIFKELLNSMLTDKKDSHHNPKRAQLLMYRLIYRTEDRENALNYLKKNLTNPDIRELLVQEYITNKNYEEALKVAQEGLLTDTYSTYDEKWKTYMLEIYENQSDIENVVLMLKYLIIHGSPYSNQYSVEIYYDKLKEWSPVESWQTNFDELEKGLAPRENMDNQNYEKLVALYILEGYFDKLFQLLSMNLNINRITDLETDLRDLNPEEYARLYAKAIFIYVTEKIGRYHYQEACRYLRKLKKIGGIELTNQTITQLQTTFKNRPALMQELAKLSK